MRIAAVVPEAFGGFGGIAQYMRDFLGSAAAGSSVEALTVIPRLVREDPGQIAPNIDQRSAAARGLAGYLREIIRCSSERVKYDLVICGHLHLLPFAKLLSARFAAPIVLIVYGVEVWEPSAHPFSNWLAKHVHATISISDETLRRFRRWTKPGLKQYVLPNAVHLEQLSSGPKPPHLLDRYQIHERKVLLTLGRLVKEELTKGVDTVIQILPRLLSVIPDLVYVVAGEGDARPYLEELTRQVGVEKNVIFAGRIAEAEKQDVYRLADAFVLAGRREGFGFVLLEAMACGVPVVASSLDGSREAVRDGALGAVVNPDDHDELVSGILDAFNKPHVVPDGVRYFSYTQFSHRLHAILGEMAA